MPGKPVKIGPFVGGLNNVSQSGESKDNEVVELVNMELSLDTSLVSRPPIESVPGTASNLANQWDVLGVYRTNSSTWSAIVNVPTGATTYEVRAYPNADFTATPIVIKTTTGLNNKIVSYVQYNNYGYFNVDSGATDTGFKWLSTGAATTISTMPRGKVMVSWEDRIWITADGTNATGNYVWFSTVDATGPKPDTWNTAVDFFNVDPGSGGLNTAMLPLINSILIFKEDATYRFSFPVAPKNGDLSAVSRQIGAASANSVVAFENYCYIYDQGRVYELINTRFSQLNLNVNFGQDAAAGTDALATGVAMSIVNRRLVVRYFNSVYSFSIDTRTWTQWRSINGTPGKFIELPTDSASSNPSVYLSATRGQTQNVGTNQLIDPAFIDPVLNAKRLASVILNGSGSINNGVMTMTKTGTGFPEFFLNNDGQSGDYVIPVSPFQRLTFSATVSSTETGTNKFELHYNFLYRDGSTTVTVVNILAADIPTLSDEITIPSNAILMTVSIKVAAASAIGTVVTVMTPNLLRSNVASPVGLLRLIDQYQNTTAVEYIECWVKTKAYDYQANSVYKRLFLWGVDIKTPRKIELQAIPLGRKSAVTWDELEGYTWAQLEAGTWDNPLSWLGISTKVTDITDNLTEISENDRFFVKAPKSLKFRQIQYAVKTTTLGNSDTGPVKLFSLTTYTKAGEMVVAKAT